MSHICMLVGLPHASHPIIRRQIPTLLAAGHRVSVLNPDPNRARINGLDYTVVHVAPVTLAWPGRLVWIPLRRLLPTAGEAWWTLIHVLQCLLTALPYAWAAYRCDAQHYQAHDLYSLLPAWIVGRLKRRRVIYDAHELVSEQHDPRSLRSTFERVLERCLVPRADEVVVPSTARGEVYAQRCGLRSAPVVVLNCPPAATVMRSHLLRQRLGLGSAQRIVLYHGSLMAGRALPQLLRAAAHFDPETTLVMIGEQNDYYTDVLRPVQMSERLEKRVVFVPFVEPEEVLQYVASADLGVVIYENVNLNNYLCAPTKLYEFLMASVPVVVSAFPELLHFLREFPVGASFDPSDPESIASAVNATLRASPAERGLRAAAVQEARQIFTWERESAKLLHVFGGAA